MINYGSLPINNYGSLPINKIYIGSISVDCHCNIACKGTKKISNKRTKTKIILHIYSFLLYLQQIQPAFHKLIAISILANTILHTTMFSIPNECSITKKIAGKKTFQNLPCVSQKKAVPLQAFLES